MEKAIIFHPQNTLGSIAGELGERSLLIYA